MKKVVAKPKVKLKSRSKVLAMPESVRVGCYEFAIIPAQHQNSVSIGFHGHTNFVGLEIMINESTSAQHTANTFLHEVIHAINYVYDICDESTEEEIATRLANGLCAFWQDNPVACAWWQSLNNA